MDIDSKPTSEPAQAIDNEVPNPNLVSPSAVRRLLQLCLLGDAGDPDGSSCNFLDFDFLC